MENCPKCGSPKKGKHDGIAHWFSCGAYLFLCDEHLGEDAASDSMDCLKIQVEKLKTERQKDV